MTAPMTPSFPIMTRLLLAFLLLFTSALSITGCSDASNADDVATTGMSVSDEPESPAQRIARVSALDMTPRTFQEIIPITGSVMAPSDASLSAQTAGTLTELAAVGTRVESGQVVAQLDDRLIRAGLEQARAALASAESQARLAEETWRRQEPLFQDSIISALEFENVLTQRNQARSTLAQAQAAVAQAEQQLENTLVRAPFAGTVEERFAERGEQVLPGSPIVRVVNTRNLKVTAGVPETYAVDIRRGSGVTLSFRAYTAVDRQATVSFVGSVINPQNRTFQIEIDLDNPDGLLKPAMIADVKLTRRTLSNQMVIPQTAVLRDETGTSVYVVETIAGQTVAQRRSITVGASYEGQTVVTSGLASGDRVITAGQTSVSDGDQVTVAH
jgi:membrane fusion protein (multidrug efflux system)